MLLDAVIVLIPVALAAHVIPILGGFIMIFFYYPVFESSKIQATIGKHLMGIQVTTLAGGRISFRDGCLRLFIKLVSMTCLFLGHFLAMFTEQKRAAHDWVAGSIVVYGRCEMPVADAWISQIRTIFGGSLN